MKYRLFSSLTTSAAWAPGGRSSAKACNLSCMGSTILFLIFGQRFHRQPVAELAKARNLADAHRRDDGRVTHGY